MFAVHKIYRLIFYQHHNIHYILKIKLASTLTAQTVFFSPFINFVNNPTKKKTHNIIKNYKEFPSNFKRI